MLYFARKRKRVFTTGIFLALVFIVMSYVPPLAAASEEARVAELKKEAAKEGKLSLHTSINVTDASFLVGKFQKKYPFIKVELQRSNDPLIMTRLQGEQRARKNTLDVLTARGGAAYLMQKMGFLAKYASPERRFYAEGFKDAEGYWTDMYPTVHCLAYNTRLVTPQDVPTTYQDLLKPQWKGKIGFCNSNYMWLEAVMQIMGKEKGMHFLEALGRQNLMVRDGSSLNIILAAAGEVAITIPVNANLVEKEKGRGAPVDWARIKPYYGEIHPVAMTANAPHPNAAKLFIDYALSQEGQDVMIEMGHTVSRKGLKSKIIRAEEINAFDPALGERIEYYQKLVKKLFVK